jgi:hypothetical protein
MYLDFSTLIPTSFTVIHIKYKLLKWLYVFECIVDPFIV